MKYPITKFNYIYLPHIKRTAKKILIALAVFAGMVAVMVWAGGTFPY